MDRRVEVFNGNGRRSSGILAGSKKGLKRQSVGSGNNLEGCASNALDISKLLELDKISMNNDKKSNSSNSIDWSKNGMRESNEMNTITRGKGSDKYGCNYNSSERRRNFGSTNILEFGITFALFFFFLFRLLRFLIIAKPKQLNTKQTLFLWILFFHTSFCFLFCFVLQSDSVRLNVFYLFHISAYTVHTNTYTHVQILIIQKEEKAVEYWQH